MILIYIYILNNCDTLSCEKAFINLLNCTFPTMIYIYLMLILHFPFFYIFHLINNDS